MIKKRLFLILFVILIPNVLSLTEESLYSGWVNDGASINAGGFNFSFKVVPERGVLIAYNDKTMIIMKNDCKSQDNLHICVGDNITWSYRNLTLWKDVYKAEVDIWALKGEIVVTKNFEQTSFLIGDSSNVKMYVENTGSKAIHGIVVKEEYPIAFKITEVSGCSLENNTIIWEGNLNPHIREGCSYRITAIDTVSYSSSAKATYNDGLASNSASSESQALNVQNYSIQIEPYILNTTPEVGYEQQISFLVKNIHPSEVITVSSLKINIPEIFQVIDKDLNIDGDNGDYIWRGSIDPEDKVNLSMMIRSERTGRRDIALKYFFVEGKYQRHLSRKIGMEVTSSYLNISYALKNSTREGYRILEVYLNNPSSKYSFRDVDIKVSSDIPFADDASRKYDTFSENRRMILYNSEIEINKDYYYDIEVNYKSDYWQNFVISENLRINKEGITISEKENISSREEQINKSLGSTQEQHDNSAVAAPEKISFMDNLSIDYRDKTPFVMIAGVFVVLLLIAVMIGWIKLKKDRREKPPINTESALILVLFFIFGSFLFYSFTPVVLGNVIYDANHLSGQNSVILFFIFVLFLSMIMVIYKRD